MGQFALTEAAILTPFNLIEEGTILVSEKKVIAVGPHEQVKIPPDFRQVSLEGLLIAPGFIDQHLHGGGGAGVMDGTKESLLELARFHATHGTTSFLATTTSGTRDQLVSVAKSFADLTQTDYKGASCLGLHLEGPYISAKYSGVHPVNTLRIPSLEEILTIHRLSGMGVRLVTMAPELPGSFNVSRTLAKEGILCAIGHSDANYEIAIAALEAGFSCVTHCFNQLRPFHHRDPGVIGAALTKPDLWVELIADGVHLHKAAVDMVWRAKGSDNIILVSDAESPTGLLDGNFQTVAGEVVLSKGTLRNRDGQLAGGALTLEQAIKNVLYYTDCSLMDAFKMATYNSARFLGINKRKGSLYPGKDADLVILTPDLDVVATMVNGEIISGLISL